MFTLGTAILGEEPCEAFSGPSGLGKDSVKITCDVATHAAVKAAP